MSEDKQPLSAFPNGNKTPENMGLSMRDYFAALALKPILSQDDYGVQSYNACNKMSDGTPYAQYWATQAYEIAYAMMEAREK